LVHKEFSVKKLPLTLALIGGIGFSAYMLWPEEQKPRANVIDSSARGAAQPQPTGEPSNSATSTTMASNSQPQSNADGNTVGLPIRMINNAPSFNQIVAAGSIVNGAVDQKEATAFIELTTSKRIASLNLELAKLKTEIAKANVDKAESDKKLGLETTSDNSNNPTADEFTLPDETPLDVRPAPQGAPSLLVDSPVTNNRDEAKVSTLTPDTVESVKYTNSIKLKGLTGDGRVALQLGSDFASNVIVGQVVWGRYRIELIDHDTSCIEFTDLRVKRSRGRACYN
jgi:hypothetical protein